MVVLIGSTSVVMIINSKKRIIQPDFFQDDMYNFDEDALRQWH